MWVWVDRFGGVLIDASLSALVLWSLAALAMLVSRQPARRLWIARASVMGALAIWPLVGLGLVPRLEVAGVLRAVGVWPHPALASWLEPGSRRVAEPLPATWKGPPEPAGAAPIDWAVRGLSLTYVAGVACALGWLCLGSLALGWMSRHAVEPSPASAELYESLPFSGRRRPRLRVSGRLWRPVLGRVFRPSLLVPAALDRPEARDRLRLALLHELAHAEARDPAHGLLANLAWALWFGAPPLWWVLAQLRLDQEFLADRRAAEHFGPMREYASTLLEIATSRMSGSAEAVASSPVRGTGSALFQRILMLLRCPYSVEARPPLWWSWGLPCLSVVLTLGVSSLSVRSTSNDRRPVATTPRRFQVARLETYPSTPGPQGRASPCELPVRLPESFELTVEVWGNARTLSRTRVAGLALDDPRPVAVEPDRWHAVRLVRDRRGARLSIDDRPVPLARTHPPLTAWLSVEPATAEPGSFQNLSLTW